MDGLKEGILMASFLIVIAILIFILYGKLNPKQEYIPVDSQPIYQVVKIGDYIEYNCGYWKGNVDLPTEQGEFGGQIGSMSKSRSITPYLEYNNRDDGWIVLGINESTQMVSIVHAGTPIAYYHQYKFAKDSLTNIAVFCNQNFLNADYATSIRGLDLSDLETIRYNDNIDDDIENRIIATGSWYWLATDFNDDLLWSINDKGLAEFRVADGAFGIRPVVTLKYSVLVVSGNGTKLNPYKLAN